MPFRSRRARLLVAATTLLVPAAMLAGVETASAAPAAPVAIQGTLPTWLSQARPGVGARALSKAAPAAASKKLTIRVYLAPRGGQAALEQAVAAVSDPSSPTYGQFLTTDQFRSAYEPTGASVKRVSRWLKAKHLKVEGTEAQHRYVKARGTVARLDKAFGITLTVLQHDGKKVIAPTTAATMPAAVASSVLTVSGLDTTKVTMKHDASPKVPVPGAYQNARPCSRYFGQLDATYKGDYTTKLPKFKGATLPYVTCGYTGVQLRSAYTPGSKLHGSGVTVAITDAYAWQDMAKDAEYYAATHGDGSYAKGQFTQNTPSGYSDEEACDPSGWSGEESLDVESVHALAPDAKIRYYASKSCNDDDLTETLGRVVDENVAKVVTSSWGGAESDESGAGVYADDQVFLQGAMQGITFLFSSGDNGDELQNTGFKQADYPASNPYVTAVGGTSTEIDGDGNRFDSGWGTVKSTLSADGTSWTSVGFGGGSGGGYSSLFERPAYQQGVVQAADAPGRAVPDVAMDADPNTGFLVGQTQRFKGGAVRYGEYRIGGTSLASPLFAAMTAVTIQQNGGRGFGQLNPVLYKNPTKIATDVHVAPTHVGVVRSDYVDPTDSSSATLYSVREFGKDSSLGVRQGWDAVTGLGVPSAGFLKLTTPAPAVAAAKR